MTTDNTQDLLADGDLDAIADVVARAQAAQADAAALLALHADGAVIVNLAGRRVLGREAFGYALTTALASPLADVRTEVTIDDIRAVTADVVVVSATKTVHDRRSSPDEHAPLPNVGVLTYMLIRDADRWLIALAQTTPVLSA